MLILRESHAVGLDVVPQPGAEIYNTITGESAVADGISPISALSFAAPSAGGLSQSGAGTFTNTGSGSNVGGLASATTQIIADESGAMAFGAAFAGKIESSGVGGLTFGCIGYGDATTMIRNVNAAGSLTFGYAYGSGSTIQTQGNGAMCGGYATNGGDILAQAQGSWAFGKADGTNSLMRAYTSGAICFGACAAGGKIYSGNYGAFASGYAGGAGNVITASAGGSFAMGFADTGGFDITASGVGSMAVGRANTASIVASASNSAQFGPGSNNQADSVSIGSTIRLKGTVAAPTTPRNGDIWVASNYVYIRSNGASVKIV